eukprot:jgi/Mesen1/2617/ME000166S01742
MDSLAAEGLSGALGGKEGQLQVGRVSRARKPPARYAQQNEQLPNKGPLQVLQQSPEVQSATQPLQSPVLLSVLVAPVAAAGRPASARAGNGRALEERRRQGKGKGGSGRVGKKAGEPGAKFGEYRYSATGERLPTGTVAGSVGATWQLGPPADQGCGASSVSVAFHVPHGHSGGLKGDAFTTTAPDVPFGGPYLPQRRGPLSKSRLSHEGSSLLLGGKSRPSAGAAEQQDLLTPGGVQAEADGLPGGCARAVPASAWQTRGAARSKGEGSSRARGLQLVRCQALGGATLTGAKRTSVSSDADTDVCRKQGVEAGLGEGPGEGASKGAGQREGRDGGEVHASHVLREGQSSEAAEAAEAQRLEDATAHEDDISQLLAFGRSLALAAAATTAGAGAVLAPSGPSAIGAGGSGSEEHEGGHMAAPATIAAPDGPGDGNGQAAHQPQSRQVAGAGAARQKKRKSTAEGSDGDWSAGMSGAGDDDSCDSHELSDLEPKFDARQQSWQGTSRAPSTGPKLPGQASGLAHSFRKEPGQRGGCTYHPEQGPDHVICPGPGPGPDLEGIRLEAGPGLCYMSHRGVEDVGRGEGEGGRVHQQEGFGFWAPPFQETGSPLAHTPPHSHASPFQSDDPGPLLMLADGVCDAAGEDADVAPEETAFDGFCARWQEELAEAERWLREVRAEGGLVAAGAPEERQERDERLRLVTTALEAREAFRRAFAHAVAAARWRDAANRRADEKLRAAEDALATAEELRQHEEEAAAAAARGDRWHSAEGVHPACGTPAETAMVVSSHAAAAAAHALYGAGWGGRWAGDGSGGGGVDGGAVGRDRHGEGEFGQEEEDEVDLSNFALLVSVADRDGGPEEEKEEQHQQQEEEEEPKEGERYHKEVMATGVTDRDGVAEKAEVAEVCVVVDEDDGRAVPVSSHDARAVSQFDAVPAAITPLVSSSVVPTDPDVASGSRPLPSPSSPLPSRAAGADETHAGVGTGAEAAELAPGATLPPASARAPAASDDLPPFSSQPAEPEPMPEAEPEHKSEPEPNAEPEPQHQPENETRPQQAEHGRGVEEEEAGGLLASSAATATGSTQYAPEPEAVKISAGEVGSEGGSKEGEGEGAGEEAPPSAGAHQDADLLSEKAGQPEAMGDAGVTGGDGGDGGGDGAQPPGGAICAAGTATGAEPALGTAGTQVQEEAEDERDACRASGAGTIGCRDEGEGGDERSGSGGRPHTCARGMPLDAVVELRAAALGNSRAAASWKQKQRLDNVGQNDKEAPPGSDAEVPPGPRPLPRWVRGHGSSSLVVIPMPVPSDEVAVSDAEAEPEVSDDMGGGPPYVQRTATKKQEARHRRALAVKAVAHKRRAASAAKKKIKLAKAAVGALLAGENAALSRVEARMWTRSLERLEKRWLRQG